ncbi:Hypothetical predicted protein [Cloeon dipterum]|uniref:Uncharacterized protein n=1 Tax=Cloeon dipterum TaxID=197152 RepID=A0A8S1CU43_9INSE|nr:Hypothetical predicted protein [Cloeon dipterum]
MASVKFVILLVLIAVAMVASVPMPEPLFFGPKHEHIIVHVPKHIHTVNHHIVHKVPVAVPVYIEKDVHAGWW